MPKKHISRRSFRVGGYVVFPKIQCEGNRHYFASNFFGKTPIEHELTDETRERIQEMTGKGAGQGSIKITQRKYNSFAVCLCGKHRESRGSFWKVEKR